MSSQSPAALPSTTPSSSSTSTPSSPLSNTSTLLFGFLVSALSIFAIFMTVAIIWNRLVARRRAIDTMLEISAPLYPQRFHRPTMWDVWAMPDKQPPPWIDVKPVAIQRCNFPASSPQTAQTERTISFWRHRLLNCFPPEITYLFRRPIPHASAVSSDTDIRQLELSHGSDVQISLLICMPRPPQSKQEERPEMVFATTNVVYHDPGPS